MDNPKLADRANQRMIVVDDGGNPTGQITERWKAHSAPGVRHLAVGILVFNGKNELILHKRINTKVGGDTIDYPVTHVLDGETPEESCYRCLQHEYGIRERLPLKRLFAFPYNFNYSDGTCENEYLLVFSLRYDGAIEPNPGEMAGELITIPVEDLIRDAESNKEKYSVWFLHTIDLMKKQGIA